MPPEDPNEAEAFERALASQSDDHYVLRLYVTGTTPKSLRAIQNLRGMCEAYLQGRYDMEVVDIYQQPSQAQSDQIIVSPTLIKSLPLPSRRLIGDLSNADRVLISLDIVPAAGREPGTSE